MSAVEIGPVPEAERIQTPADLFLIWAGANIVATTIAVGASLAGSIAPGRALPLIVAGSLVGGLIVAALAPLGPRLGVPSIIAARAALGIRGAGLVALFMYVTNFAWIAVNNVIAASACRPLLGGFLSERWLAFALGVLATAIVSGGPGLVAKTDRIAVPLLIVVSVAMTVACLRLPAVPAASTPTKMSLLRGLDVVIGYQVSWILMFADYSRYTRSGRGSLVAVFFGLGLTSAWLMPLGFLAAQAAGTPEPAAMLAAVGLGTSGGLLMALGTVTTNFVNIYLSALAWRSLLPRTPQQAALWGTGLVGAGLSLLSRKWLDSYGDFMILLGGGFVPVGGILIAHYFLMRRPVDVAALYDSRGAYSRHLGFSVPGLIAWATGAVVYYALLRSGIEAIGSTLPAFVSAVVVYVAAERALSA